MKKRIGLFLILVSAVLIFSGCGKNGVGNNSASNSKDDAIYNSSTPKSVDQIIASGKPLVCTFNLSNAEQGYVESGRYYFDGKKTRFRIEMEISMKSLDKKIATYMISDGTYVYSWDNTGGTTGHKTKMVKDAPATVSSTSTAKTPDYSQGMNFDCQKWSVDNSKFALPAGIEFIESAN